jgi:predicted dehydrogenase
VNQVEQKLTNEIGRREFLQSTVAAGLVIVKPGAVRGSEANSSVRIGVLGCGGRAMQVVPGFITNPIARIVALADLFEDKLQAARQHYDELAALRGIPAIDESQLFKGPKSAEEIVASKELDAVLITTPPYYHPDHLDAAVAAGKHVYLEKPVSVDVHGAKRVMLAGERAQGRLSLHVGFQIRSAPPYVEMVRRIHNGALGEIVCGDAHSCFPPLNVPQRSYGSVEERRIRTWFYDRVLSGDILVEQNIHALDVCNWILQARPVKAVGASGRKMPTRPGEDTSDHFNITFYYPGDVHLSFSSTKLDRGWWDVNERFFGTKGISESHYAGGVRIYGDEPWDSGFGGQSRFWHGTNTGAESDALKDAEPEKQKAFLQGIITGNFDNQAVLGAESTLSAILGRTAGYTGKEVAWDEMVKSDESLDAGINLNKFA